MRNFLIFLLVILSMLPKGSVTYALPGLQTTSAAEMIDAINASRYANGRYPFQLNATLVGIAQSHSNYQASISDSTHISANGSLSTDRALSAGYGGGADIQVDEMIYFGPGATAAAAIEWWLNSEVYTSILLSGEYHEFGVGVSSDGTSTYISITVGLVTGVTSPLPFIQATPLGGGSESIENTPVATSIPESGNELQPELGNVDNGIVGEDQQSITSPQIEGNTTTENTQPGILQNPIFLWSILIVQFLAIGGLGYYIWTERRERAAIVKEHKSRAPLVEDKHFTQLSYEEQFKRLEKMGRKALENYNLEVVRITPLQYRLNASFQVEALSRDEPGADLKKYILRINSPTFQSEANIRSEMLWLNAIHRDTQLVTPDPLRTIDRSLVTTVEMDGIPEQRHAVVLGWLEGKAISKNLTPEILSKVGVFTGKLHQHAINYNPPVEFERRQWDMAGFSGEMLDVPLTKARRGLTAKQLTTIEAAAKKVEKVIDELGRDPEFFGLIHADLYERNYMMLHGEIRALDFNVCGWGYFLYELAVTLSTLVSHPEFTHLKNSLLDGYRQIRFLPVNQEKLIVPFIAARFMSNLFWLAGHKNEPAFAQDAPKLIERNIEFLEQFSRRG